MLRGVRGYVFNYFGQFLLVAGIPSIAKNTLREPDKID